MNSFTKRYIGTDSIEYVVQCTAKYSFNLYKSYISETEPDTRPLPGASDCPPGQENGKPEPGDDAGQKYDKAALEALLGHYGADALIDTALTPVTAWWLGLPPELGVPILFGVLRKELSLLMVQQALGTADVGDALSTAQIFTFLVFLTFYVPCLSTFAVMLKALGRREAWFSVGVSLACALLLGGLARLASTLFGLAG